MNLRLSRRGRLADAEPGSRLEQIASKSFCVRMRAPKNTTRDPSRVLETRHGFADIVERGTRVVVERHRVNSPHRKRDLISLSENALRHGYRVAQQRLGFCVAP